MNFKSSSTFNMGISQCRAKGYILFPIRSFSYWKGPSKEVLLEQGEIPLLFSFSLQGSFTSFFRTFPFDYVKVAAPRVLGRNEKTADAQLPQISHDLGIVVPRACAKIKKDWPCRFRARGDDAFAWLARAGGGAQGNQVWPQYEITVSSCDFPDLRVLLVSSLSAIDVK